MGVCRDYIQSVKNHEVCLIPRNLILPSPSHLANAVDTSNQDEKVSCRHSVHERTETAILDSLVRPGRKRASAIVDIACVQTCKKPEDEQRDDLEAYAGHQDVIGEPGI